MKNNSCFSSFKPKVLILSWEFPPRIIGGLSTHVYHISRALSFRGAIVQVITCDFPNVQCQQTIDGVQVLRVNSSGISEKDFLLWIYFMNSLMIEKASKILDKDQFDIIHAHDWMVGRAALKLKNYYNIPLVTTVHATEIGRGGGNLYHYHQKIIHYVERLLISHSERVICCSNYMSYHIKENFGISNDKIHVIPNAVDILRFHSAPSHCQVIANLRQRYNISSDEKVILYVGRLVREKGIYTLIDAFEMLWRRKMINLNLVIVGEGPIKESLMTEVRNRGLQKHIHFIGFIDEVTLTALYRSSDVFIVPSLYEPFGIVVLEAMASGVPVVVSDVGGLSDIVENGVTGLKFPSGDSDSLVAAIRCVLEFPSVAEHLKLNAYDYIVKRCNWDLVAEKTLQTYNQAMLEDRILSTAYNNNIQVSAAVRDEDFLTGQGLLRLLFTLGATKKEGSKTAQEVADFLGASEISVKLILGELASKGYISTIIVSTMIDPESTAVEVRYHLTERGIISACADFS